MFARLRTCLPGKERDQESGLDYFGARYFGSSMGRWMSPDWSAKEELVPYAKLDNPQSLNLYAYVGNNPQSNSDTDGHECISHVNADSGFCVRATEYSQINANPAINSKTVFFEAAAEVSTALNSVNTNAGRLFFNSETVNVRL
jgi:RHS repeat-associated protein